MKLIRLKSPIVILSKPDSRSQNERVDPVSRKINPPGKEMININRILNIYPKREKLKFMNSSSCLFLLALLVDQFSRHCERLKGAWQSHELV